MFDKNKPVLGLDIGNVITGDMDGGVLFSDRYLNVPDIPGAISGAGELNRIFAGQVCLVSKCCGIVQVKTREWFAYHRFFDRTGINPNHIFFCEEWRGKSPICRHLGVSHFVDDRLEVLGYMQTVRNRFLFRPDEKEMVRNLEHVNAVRRVESWQELLNVIPMTL